MKTSVLLAVCLLPMWWGCRPEYKSPDTGTTASNTTLADKPAHSCKVGGHTLDGNQRLLHDHQTLVVIKADSAGANHHILEIWNTRNCTLLKRYELPTTQNAGFAYQIADILYNNLSRIVAIRGLGSVLCYDIDSGTLSKQLSPKFAHQSRAAEASSGEIRRLELWENYLVGYADQLGAFVFDLRVKNNPKPVMPIAEFGSPDSPFNSLFLVESANGVPGMQAILPYFDTVQQAFLVNPILPQPANLVFESAKIPFAVLRHAESKLAVVVDMVHRQRLDIPMELANQSAAAILKKLGAK
jgi:hypothetical protein